MSFRKLTIDEVRNWDREKCAEEADQRVSRALAIREANGGGLKALSKDLHEEVMGIVGDLAVIRTAEAGLIPESKTDPFDEHGRLTRMVHPNSGGSSVVKGLHTPGWKTGTWSSPFLKKYKDLTPSGSVTVPALSAGVVRIEDRPTRIFEVTPITPLGPTDQFAFLQETARAHAAAPVARGAKKPASTYQVAKIEDRARQIAHITQPIDRADLEDAQLLQQYIDLSLRAGVMLSLDNEIVNGDGVGERFTGIANTSGRSLQPFDTDIFTSTRKGVSILEDDEIMGGSFLLNPDTYEAMELAVDNEARYRFGGPLDRAERRLWGKPVIVSSTVPVGLAYLVDFQGSTRLYERSTVRIDFSQDTFDPDHFGVGVGGSDFEANQIRFRGEARYGFAVLRPAGIVEIDVLTP